MRLRTRPGIGIPVRPGLGLALGLLLLSVGGCRAVAQVQANPDIPAQRLLTEGRVSLKAGEFEEAYDAFKQIHEGHPKSQQAEDAFAPATRAFRGAYQRHRYQKPATRWETTEPEYLFDWLAYHVEADDFPQDLAEALFVGLPEELAQRLVDYGAGVPATAAWHIEPRAEAGVVVAVTLSKADTQARRGL